MKATLFDIRMHDGSRHFASMPCRVSYETLRDHMGRLNGATVTGYLTDDITEMWLDFTYRGHRFSINDQLGEYWFFVEDPACPEEILGEVAEHAGSLVEE